MCCGWLSDVVRRLQIISFSVAAIKQHIKYSIIIMSKNTMPKRKRTIMTLFFLVSISLYGFQIIFILTKIEAFIDSKKQAETLRKQFSVYSKTNQGQSSLSNFQQYSSHKTKTSFWELNLQHAELQLKTLGANTIRKVITAYLEPPLNDTIPGTGYQENPSNPKDKGAPPEFYIPLPIRKTTPADLKKYEYPRFKTCKDLPAKLPVDRGLEIDEKSGKTIIRNLGNQPTPEHYPWQEAPYCPVDADPFLPWIHDVFPSSDATKIEFIAQNKRRCKSGRTYYKDILRMTPQVALLQPISVERIDETKANQLAPGLWEDTSNKDNSYRYRLAPYDEASPDGMWTRFICRFHTTDFSTGKPKTDRGWETLSKYIINYEFAGLRKGRSQLLVPQGRETNLFWTSTLMFSCPIPPELQPLVKNGSTILSDGTPTLHVDVIPIRTSARYGSKEVYLNEQMAGPKHSWDTSGKGDTFNNVNITSQGFNASLRWGTNHVLPKVEASGRWTNLPVCQPPKMPMSQNKDSEQELKQIASTKTQPSKKPYMLSACLWSSASFAERGIKEDHHRQRDTTERLKEWIEFHLMVGFDHIYVYDNSGAHAKNSSLEEVTNMFPSSQITRIDWPSLICNNNIPAHPNAGERSSQYAAENSCRTRFSPFSEWMATFDTDEYLVPMGNHSNLKTVVQDAAKKGENILTFRSTRGKLRHIHTR
jgi:hypothetical protein